MQYSRGSRVLAEVHRNLRVAVVGTKDARPLWPRVVATAEHRRLGQQLKVRDGLRAVAHRGTDTVVTGVTTTDHDDILALRADVVAVLELGVEERLGVELQGLHREVDAVDLAVGDLQVTGPGRTIGENDSVVLPAEVVRINIPADEGTGKEGMKNDVR